MTGSKDSAVQPPPPPPLLAQPVLVSTVQCPLAMLPPSACLSVFPWRVFSHSIHFCCMEKHDLKNVKIVLVLPTLQAFPSPCIQY